MQTPSFVPRCPNHGCPLDGVPFPLPNKGKGICPVSGCPFEFKADVDEERTVIDKNGNLTKKADWKISGKD